MHTAQGWGRGAKVASVRGRKGVDLWWCIGGGWWKSGLGFLFFFYLSFFFK